jgi:hypothetical protein
MQWFFAGTCKRISVYQRSPILILVGHFSAYFELRPVKICWQEEPVSPCAWATITSQMSANAGGGYENVLVIGADALSRYVDWMDRGTCILFGDAAGALVLQVCSVLPLFLYAFCTVLAD